MKSTAVEIVFLVMTLFFVRCDFHTVPEPEPFKISLKTSGNGAVHGFPSDSMVTKGDTLVLTAEPDTGWYFYGWTVPEFTADNPLDVHVTEPLTIHAGFARTPERMAFIPAKDAQFTMGTSDGAAMKLERPAHSVRFSYDFYMGTHEVTVGEYRAYIASLPVGAAQQNDSLPITFLTWYDAVLYCNALSIAEGYDTVYSYSARCETVGECPYVLENCTIHYDRFGYRLPTEAEWEYACRAGNSGTYFWGNDTAAAADYAWYFGNSSNSLHQVGLKKPNGFGLFDIEGNVAEWVSDWLDYFVDSLYVDPVGPVHLTEEQFAESWERPIKGGSYRLNAAMLRPSMRKGPYPMTASVVQKDVGFRVALGAFRASETAPEVIIPDSLDARIVANRSDCITFAQTHKIKAAFVYTVQRKRFCALADFSESPVVLRQCSDDTAVVQPMFSPDGRYIAWGSREEGFSGNSTVSIRSLDTNYTLTDSFPGFLPRFWVDPDAADTFIVYTDGASINTQPFWNTERTLRCRIRGGKRSGTPEVLWDRGSYHGGLSSDGRFLGTAYTRAKLVDLQMNDTNIFYFVPPWNGRDDDIPQVCNFSMSPSKANPGEALFLDFGYPKISTLVGRSYTTHEIIFVGNTKLFSREQVSSWFVVPSEYEMWNYSEYTNHPAMITALAEPFADSADGAIFLINGPDSSYLKLIEGKGLKDVAVWIDPVEYPEEDDPYRHFGKYDVPVMMNGHVALAKKMRLLWHERDNFECVALGNSPMYYGFDPRQITTLPTINVAWYSGNIGTSLTLATEYVLPLVTNLKVMILDLDASYFKVDCRKFPRLIGLYYTKGFELDSSHNFYRDSIPEAVARKAAAFTEEEHWRGFNPQGAFRDSMIGNGWGEAEFEGEDFIYSMDDSVVKANLAFFKQLIDSTAAHGVTLLVINFPQSPAYATMDEVGRHGPSRETYLQLAARMRSYEEQYPHFHFYDANNGGDHDYTDAEAFDMNHLNSRGGAKLGARVDSLLQYILE